MIKDLRIKSGMSQADLATTLGVSQQMVSQWENGIKHPRVNNLLRLAEIFRCTVDELLRDGGEEGEGDGEILHG